jgi:hypothetical protein
MSNFGWTQTIANLTAVALTVRAQTISPNDNGLLKWDLFFPRRDVDSVDLEDVTTLDYRPSADRREWNQRGRLIPIKTPDRRKVSIVPIEAYYTWGEYEIQKLNERTLGNAQNVAQIMQASIPDRVDALVMANYRRLELDAFTAWALGSITQRNPQNAAETYQASFGFAAARYQTAATAWNDVGQNAYNNLTAWINDAIDAVGPIRGVVSRRNFINEVLRDAPTMAGGNTMTFVSLEQRIQDDTGSDFRFFPMEDTVEQFDDGGVTTTATKVWAAQRIAAVPASTAVGNTAFAPVVRAMELARSVPGAGISVNGQTVYYEEQNGGRELTVEAQVNAIPVPDEQKMFVMNVGF